MHDETYRLIPLQSGDEIRGHTKVELGDYAALARERWALNNNGYAYRSVIVNGRRRARLMHRVILGLEFGDQRESDHINRDKLDNRRSNLRIVTHAQNLQNKSSHRGSSSRFRCVHWAENKRKWRVRPRIDGRYYEVGHFKSELAAALAAESWRQEHMPFAEPDPELLAALTNL